MLTFSYSETNSDLTTPDSIQVMTIITISFCILLVISSQWVSYIYHNDLPFPCLPYSYNVVSWCTILGIWEKWISFYKTLKRKKNTYMLIKLNSYSSSSIGCGAGDHKVFPCMTIISKCGNLLFLHCSFIIPKQSLYIIKVWSTWSSRSPFANGRNVQSISSSRLFLWLT